MKVIASQTCEIFLSDTVYIGIQYPSS